MAHSTLPVFSHPDFPQVFEAALNQLVTRQVPQLSPCCYESAESRWGAGDAIACTQPAVIHDVATEMDYCFAHYKAVNRG